jgi:hypothetical protein
MKEISKTKTGYGISQVKTSFSANFNISNDEKAIAGKRILQEMNYYE